MKDAPKPVKFRQVFVQGEAMFALDLHGSLWCCNWAIKGMSLPPSRWEWKRCAMPQEETE